MTHEPDIARFAKRILLFRDGAIRRDERVREPPVARDVLENMPVLED